MIFRKLRRDTWEYRNRYGQLQGLLVYNSMLDEIKRERNTVYSIRLPDLRHEVSLRAKTSDYLTFEQLYLRREVDIPLTFVPKVIVDAGANIGLSSIVYANKYPNSKIWAIEMEGANFEMLSINSKNYPNIIPVNRALWGRNESISITNPNAEEWAFRVDAGDADSESSVNAITMKEIIDIVPDNTIDLLKLDIEGGELNLFHSEDLSWLDRVKVMAIELHDRFQPGCTDALMQAISGRNYTLNRHGEYVLVEFL